MVNLYSSNSYFFSFFISLQTMSSSSSASSARTVTAPRPGNARRPALVCALDLSGRPFPVLCRRDEALRGGELFDFIRVPWNFLQTLSQADRADIEVFLLALKRKHAEIRERLRSVEVQRIEYETVLRRLESHPRDWVRFELARVAPMPWRLRDYCIECFLGAPAARVARGAVRCESDGDFAPDAVKDFMVSWFSCDAEARAAREFVQSLRVLHGGYCYDLQHFRLKKENLDRREVELKAELRGLAAKRAKVIENLDDTEQKLRALETRPVDWEKFGLQRKYPMPEPLRLVVKRHREESEREDE